MKTIRLIDLIEAGEFKKTPAIVHKYARKLKYSYDGQRIKDVNLFSWQVEKLKEEVNKVPESLVIKSYKNQIKYKYKTFGNKWLRYHFKVLKNKENSGKTLDKVVK